jgi:hypothetical protein
MARCGQSSRGWQIWPGAALARVRALTPPSYELVYDAYSALSVGFGFSERSSEHFLHVAV